MGFADFFKNLFGGGNEEEAPTEDTQAPADDMSQDSTEGEEAAQETMEAPAEEAAQETTETQTEEATEEEQGQM